MITAPAFQIVILTFRQGEVLGDGNEVNSLHFAGSDRQHWIPIPVLDHRYIADHRYPLIGSNVRLERRTRRRLDSSENQLNQSITQFASVTEYERVVGRVLIPKLGEVNARRW